MPMISQFLTNFSSSACSFSFKYDSGQVMSGLAVKEAYNVGQRPL